jgi:hypothetical protein
MGGIKLFIYIWYIIFQISLPIKHRPVTIAYFIDEGGKLDSTFIQLEMNNYLVFNEFNCTSCMDSAGKFINSTNQDNLWLFYRCQKISINECHAKRNFIQSWIRRNKINIKSNYRIYFTPNIDRIVSKYSSKAILNYPILIEVKSKSITINQFLL